MPTPNFSNFSSINPSTSEIVNYIIKLQRDLNYLLTNLDDLNINRLDARIIVANTITGDKIIAGAITAEKIDVDELSAISADLGTITAGSITTNAEINVGTDATIGNNLYLGESDYTGSKGIIFSNDSGISSRISVSSGDFSVTCDGFMTFTIGSSQGLVVNNVVDAAAIKSDTITDQSNISVVWSGTVSSQHIEGNHDHNIPNGTQLLDADGVTVWTFNADGGFTHDHTVT